MDPGIQSAIASLQRTLAALDAKTERIRVLIGLLQAEDGREISSPVEHPAPEFSAISVQTTQTNAEIIEALDRINESDYPIEDLKGLTREGVARLVALKNNGYITAKAYKRILARSGVLRGTKQITSISSRVLAESQDFVKVWPGVYRLKEYSSEAS